MTPRKHKRFIPILPNLFRRMPESARQPCRNKILAPADQDDTSRSGHHRWRQVLARAMVVVATLGAIVSGLTAIAENEAEELARQLTQGQHLGLTYRQEQLTDRATREPLQKRLEACLDRGQQLLDAEIAAGFKKEQTSLLDRDTREAQEEFAAARALLPFVNVLKYPFDQRLTPEQILQKRMAFYLAGLGFEVRWPGPEIKSLPQELRNSPTLIWQPLTHKLEAAHKTALELALGVLLFVAALVLFALADLWKRWVIYLGGLAACGALVYSVYVIKEHGLWAIMALKIWHSLPISVSMLLLTGLLIFAAIQLILIFRSPVRAPEEKGKKKGGHLEAELHDHQDSLFGMLYPREAEGSSRNIALFIVLTVFCTALCGYLYNRSSNRAGKAAQEAVEYLIDMNCRVSQHNALINSTINGQAQVQENRARYAAWQQWQSPGETQAGGSLQQPRTWLDDPYYGIDADPQFPARLKALPLQYQDANWHEPFALWDAHSQRSLFWHHQARVYLGILTVLAMAIYLFGQGHSMEEDRASRGLVWCGLALLGASVVLAGLTMGEELRLEQTRDGEAAEHYAKAMSQNRAAASPGEFREMMTDLETAVQCRPDFALARLALANVYQRSSVSSEGADFPDYPTQAQLLQIIRLKQNALKTLTKCGYAEPPALLKSLGINCLLRGWQTKSLAEAEKGLRYLEQADGKDCGDLLLKAAIKWNLGLARLATGEGKQADTAALMASGIDQNLIIDAFTDLELLSTHYHSLQPGKKLDINPDKERLVAAWTKKSPSAVPAPEIPAAITVSAQAVCWQGKLPGYDPRQDRLFLVWYHRDQVWGAWRAIPGISGSVRAPEGRSLHGILEIERSSLAAFHPYCLPSGQFKAELFLNGRLAPGLVQTTNPSGNFMPVSLYDLNMVLCRPKKWTPIDLPPELKSQGLLMCGFQTEAGKPAAFVFTLYAPRSASRSEIINRVKAQLQKAGIEGIEEFVPYDSPEASGLAAPSTAVLYKHWLTGEGVHHVGVAFPGAAPAPELRETIDSLRNQHKSKASWDAYPFLEARAGELRFYESGRDIPEESQRVYRTRFLPLQTQYINWEMHLDVAPTEKPAECAASNTWYGPEGNILDHQIMKIAFSSGWSGNLTNGMAPPTNGKWRPGNYVLVVKINGQEMARGSFEVAGEPEDGSRRE